MMATIVSGADLVPTAALGEVGSALVIALAGSWMALLFHEVGHALAAMLVGVRIWSIQLGMGPVIWRGELGGCRIHLAVLPFLGAVRLLDEDANSIGYRDIFAGRWRFEWGPRAWRAPIISAAGGLGNLLGLALLVIWYDLAGRPSLGTFAGDLTLVGAASHIAGYLNLLPCFRSDGIHLLAHIRAARFHLQPSRG